MEDKNFVPTYSGGCKARISASLDIHGSWKINNVHLDHSHKNSPTKSRLYRCHHAYGDETCNLSYDSNDVVVVPDRYILGRWRKDINRAHTRVGVSYDGLDITQSQKRCDDMCRSFAEVADLVADEEEKCVIIRQAKEIENIKHPKASKRKGALKESKRK
ncbi:FAR1-related protein [Striga asiatica]|uniref:Protein FAR1-RELATED SEQUENCE n=1 Tax=Striga asiatica TaxID=4170 RepID=A0A5A7QWP7_STRAF|nr:FAR1-related protein [Striga asiatica]